MAPREAKAVLKQSKDYKIFPMKETLSKLYKVDNFVVMKEFIQK